MVVLFLDGLILLMYGVWDKRNLQTTSSNREQFSLNIVLHKYSKTPPSKIEVPIDGCSKLKRSVDMTSSGKNDLYIM